MLLILPLAFFALLVLCWRTGWRDAFLRALVLFATLVVLITESLSVFSVVMPAAVFTAWLAVAALACAGFRRVPLRPGRIPWWDGLLIAGIVIIAGVVGFIAVFSPPNSADAMAYHMPRVLYWAQQRSVSSFPTPYFNQIMLQPLAEYFMLHTYLLSGGDHFVNLVQWFGSIAGMIGVSSIAGLFGAGRRGQIYAALFCATLPNGILQASGAKNDYLLAALLVAVAYFALRWLQENGRQDVAALSASLALALFTKATAYLYAPCLLIGIFLPRFLQTRSRLPRAAVVCAVCILAINGPLYRRNYSLSGSPLGYDSAQGDGRFGWRNEHFGWRVTVSNVLRNASQQFGGRSQRWNQGVYNVVVRVHRWIGADVNDPATTWRWEQFEPPRNANHEADGPNRWHLLLSAAALIALAWQARRRRSIALLSYTAGVALGFVAFCFYLKWQLFTSRLFLPLFVLAAPVAGVLGERLRPAVLQAVLCLFLLNNSKPYLLENWVRPLKGPHSLLKTRRDDNYFSDMGQPVDQASFVKSVDLVAASGCSYVGVDTNEFQVEYPVLALLRERNPGVRFVHTGVTNASARFYSPSAPQPCAVVCLYCAGVTGRLDLYKTIGPPIAIDRLVVFTKAQVARP